MRFIGFLEKHETERSMKKKIGIICIILGLAIPIIAFSFAHHDPSADLLRDMCKMEIVLKEGAVKGDYYSPRHYEEPITIPYCFIVVGGIILMGIGAGLLEVKKKIYMKIDKINAFLNSRGLLPLKRKRYMKGGIILISILVVGIGLIDKQTSLFRVKTIYDCELKYQKKAKCNTASELFVIACYCKFGSPPVDAYDCNNYSEKALDCILKNVGDAQNKEAAEVIAGTCQAKYPRVDWSQFTPVKPGS